MVVYGADKDPFHYISLASNFAPDSGQTFNSTSTARRAIRADLTVAAAKSSLLSSTISLPWAIERYGCGYGYDFARPDGLSPSKSAGLLIAGLLVLAVCSFVILLMHFVVNPAYLHDLPRECRDVDALLAASLKQWLKHGLKKVGSAAHLEEKVVLRRVEGEAVHELKLVGGMDDDGISLGRRYARGGGGEGFDGNG